MPHALDVFAVATTLAATKRSAASGVTLKLKKAQVPGVCASTCAVLGCAPLPPSGSSTQDAEQSSKPRPTRRRQHEAAVAHRHA